MQLPGAKEQRNEDILNLIEEITENQDKLIRFTVENSDGDTVTLDAMYAFDSVADGEAEEAIYRVYNPVLFRRPFFRTKMALHNNMQDGLEAEIIDAADLEEEKRKKFYNRTTAMQDPIKHVYVFVKTTDDGRYKDRWNYYTGQSEDEIREREELPEPSSDEKWVYHCLGNIAELRENADQYDFDLRQFRGSIPDELRWMTGEGELDELRNQVDSSLNSGEQS